MRASEREKKAIDDERNLSFFLSLFLSFFSFLAQVTGVHVFIQLLPGTAARLKPIIECMYSVHCTPTYLYSAVRKYERTNVQQTGAVVLEGGR